MGKTKKSYIIVGIFQAIFMTRCCNISAQEYVISRPPMDGTFFLDSLRNTPSDSREPSYFITLESNNDTIYTSGKGKVVIVDSFSESYKTIGIRYGNYAIEYMELKCLFLRKNDSVVSNIAIGNLNYNEKRKKYYVRVEVMDRKERIWNKKLVHYLNAKKKLK